MSPLRRTPAWLVLSALSIALLVALTSMPMQGVRATGAFAPVGGALPPPATFTPAYGCTGNASGNGFGMSWAPLNVSNATGNFSTWIVGPAPANVTFNLTIEGPQTIYNVTVSWGDGSSNLSAVANKTVPGTAIFQYSHRFVLPAFYDIGVVANYSCTYPSGSGVTGSGATDGILQVYDGSVGWNPISVTTNITTGTGPVPLAVRYAATIRGGTSLGAGAVVNWTLISPLGQYSSFRVALNGSNFSSVSTVLSVPGWWAGWVTVSYPNSTLAWAKGGTPLVRVAPLANVSVANSVVAGNSPWNLTWWGNATDLNGSPYVGNATIHWLMGDTSLRLLGPGNQSQFWANGPIVGSPVWRVYYLNVTGQVGFGVTAELVRPDGVVLGYGTSGLNLQNGTGWNGGGGSPPLGLSVTPTNGTAPLFFNATLWQSSLNSSNPAMVRLDAIANGPSVPPIWNATIQNWTGAPTTVPGVLTRPGTYSLWATEYHLVNGSWIPTYGANATLVVNAAASTSSPAVSFSITPGNGTAPLNESLSLVAVGGTAPYDLGVCVVGPLPAPGSAGPCAPPVNATPWNGTARAEVVELNTTGNYTITASVVDAAGLTANASLSVYVGPPAPVPALSVHGSFLAPSFTTSGGATFGFVTEVSGGVAPYQIQWAFGDGSYGSALAGQTVFHTFSTAGTYTARLTVTDARGDSASTPVGPLVVTLPSALSGPWWASPATLLGALLVGVAAAAVIAYSSSRLAQRKEALNWFRALEETRDGTNDPPR